MKQILIVILPLILTIQLAQSQTTLILKPGPSQGKDAHVLSGLPSTNVEPHDEFLITSWTCSSIQCDSRQLIQFDLSAIPSNATLISAYLNLFGTPIPVTIPSTHYGPANECIIQKIMSPWQENTVTWTNQPSVSPTGVVVLPHSNSATLDYLGINLTEMAKDWIINPQLNYGIMISLTDEVYYNGKCFASSDHADANLWPELVVTYINTGTCIETKPGPTDGKDMHVLSGLPNQNNDPHPELLAVAWTCGSPCIDRSFIDFDLSLLPSNAVLLFAGLNLFSNPNPVTIPLSNYGVDNSCYIQRTTSAWSENTVTWNNQPTVSALNQVSVPHTDLSNKDYMGIDVTQLVNDMLTNPSNSFGFSIKLQNEIHYNGKNFATSDNSDASKWPSLILCYNQTQDISSGAIVDFSLEPNPFKDNIRISFSSALSGEIKISLFDASNRHLKSVTVNSSDTVRNIEFLTDPELANGVYFLTVQSENSHIVKKIIKN